MMQQKEINLLEKEAEYIICVAHLGTDESSEPNRSTDVIENVDGIDILIDAHSHSIIDGEK